MFKCFHFIKGKFEDHHRFLEIKFHRFYFENLSWLTSFVSLSGAAGQKYVDIIWRPIPHSYISHIFSQC